MAMLSLDLGTTVCKAGLLSHQGELIALRREEYPVISAHRDWAEQDTVVVWEKIQQVIAEVVGHVPAGDTIEALCVSA
jgi:sugar (pentulose or hexulose) kinase